MPLLPEPGPIRTLAAVTLVNTIGNGLWMTSSALFLTRSVGLSIGQTGLALTLVALISLVTSTPVGYLADRLGPRGVAIGALVALGLCETAMVGVRSMAGFLVVAAPMAVFEAAQRAARGARAIGASRVSTAAASRKVAASPRINDRYAVRVSTVRPMPATAAPTVIPTLVIERR